MNTTCTWAVVKILNFFRLHFHYTLVFITGDHSHIHSEFICSHNIVQGYPDAWLKRYDWSFQGPYVQAAYHQRSGKISWIIGLLPEHRTSGFMEEHRWTRKYKKNLDLWWVIQLFEPVVGSKKLRWNGILQTSSPTSQMNLYTICVPRSNIIRVCPFFESHGRILFYNIPCVLFFAGGKSHPRRS